jgi:PEGA domain
MSMKIPRAITTSTHTVLLNKGGFPDYTKSVAVVAGQVTTIDADLSKGPGTAATTAPAGTASTAPVPGEGSLSVGSTPQGAQVLVDGNVRGMTPAVIPGLSPGQHTVLLKLDGYQEFNTTVSISDGKTTEFSTALAQAKKSPGFAGILVVVVVAALALFRKRTE